jgi:hypothetical protein
MDGIHDVDKTLHNLVKFLKEKHSFNECSDIMAKMNLNLPKNSQYL